MKRILPLIMLLAAALPAQAAQDIFENRAYHYSLYCPADWAVSDKPYFTGFKPHNDSAAYQHAVLVAPSSSLDGVMNEATNDERKLGREFISVTATKISGEDAAKALFADKRDPDDLTAYYFIKKGKLVYTIKIHLYPAAIAEVGNKMVTSFTFTE